MTRQNPSSSPQPQEVDHKNKHPRDDNKTNLEGIHKRDNNKKSSNDKSKPPGSRR